MHIVSQVGVKPKTPACPVISPTKWAPEADAADTLTRKLQEAVEDENRRTWSTESLVKKKISRGGARKVLLWGEEKSPDQDQNQKGTILKAGWQTMLNYSGEEGLCGFQCLYSSDVQKKLKKTSRDRSLNRQSIFWPPTIMLPMQFLIFRYQSALDRFS